ncbi:MAG: hypothetical protein WC479_01585 [Candidatus Izemoplasmatales bacterium]|jgi:hypothetical protein|nr:hypothetical protein [Candidatus Izemoplasmatales bacterium]MDD3865884.1 hypothetical protein [Candidatus Izemoplasmatales bacterium]
MYKIRKNLLFLIIVCSAFLLIACDYEYYLYHENIRENTEVVQIDLVNYNNPIDTENSTENTVYDVEKLVILETLNSDEYENFLGELSEIGGLSSKLEQTINSPNGTGILITYQDGGVTLITVSNINDNDCIFVGHYDASANLEGFYGISWPMMIDDFKAIMLKYFDTNID